MLIKLYFTKIVPDLFVREDQKVRFSNKFYQMMGINTKVIWRKKELNFINL